jgi:hypothetical protein
VVVTTFTVCWCCGKAENKTVQLEAGDKGAVLHQEDFIDLPK